LTDDVARLYSLPLDEFIAERDATARRLRKEGDRAAADEVKKLRKPNRPAWAINQAVRAEPRAAEGLVEAAASLDKAQQAALGGGGGGEKLRTAMAELQEAVERMMEVAGQSLEPQERTPAVLDRVRDTLRAVAADDELRAEFIAGRLTRDREAVGFGGSEPQAVAARRPAKRRQAGAEGAAETARLREARRAVKTAERALRTATRRVGATEGRLERARKTQAEAQDAYDDAERERRKRETELTDARAMLAELS
jgi:hypothetical protein